MNPFQVDFGELYRRHLCRHSQLGINVLHLMAVAAIYLALLGIASALPAAPWIVAALLLIYCLTLAGNIPARLLVINVLTMAAIVLVFLALPKTSVWVYVGLIILAHRFQVWNHRIYDKSADMSAFATKYKKGPQLALLLALYELPILLNYLVFDRRNWAI